MMDKGRVGLLRSFCLVLAVVVAMGSLTGCASLRKKFTRKKKAGAKQEEFVPVLQPVEYERVEYSPQDTYKNHYAMAKVYFNDLETAITSKDTGDKGQKYLLTQLMARLRGMADLLPDTKKAGLEELIGKLAEMMKEYDKASAMRRLDLMKSSLIKIERDVHRGFKPALVEGELKTL